MQRWRVFTDVGVPPQQRHCPPRYQAREFAPVRTDNQGQREAVGFRTVEVSRARAVSERRVRDVGLQRCAGASELRVSRRCHVFLHACRAAPEMRHPARPGYGFQVDAWSVGVLVYIMCAARGCTLRCQRPRARRRLGGYHPFDPEGGADQASILAAIQTGIFDFLDPVCAFLCHRGQRCPLNRAQVWESVSEVAKDLICRLLVVDPMQRLTAAQALQHEWFTTQTVSTVPIANTEHLAEFNASMRKKLRTAMLSTLAGVRMRRAAARRRRRFSDPVHDGGSAAFSMPGRVSAALSGGAGAAAAIDETLAGQARTRLGTHSPQASPSSAAEASASGAAHTGALKPAAAALAPAPASKRSTRRLQSGYVDDDHAERRLFSGVSREYSFGSGGSSGEGPDIQRALSLAAAALRGITAAIDVAAAGKGGAPSRPLPIAGTAGMRTLAGPAGSSGGAASVGAARTRASEFSAGSGTLSSPSGGHSGSGGPPEVEGDTDPGAAAAAAGMEALLLPPQRRALMRRRARDMKESAERKRPAKSTSKSSGKGSVASVPGPGGGGAGHPPRPTRDASWSSRSTHVSALTVRSATAAYDASKVAGTVSGVPRRLGYSRRAPAEDSSTRSLPGAARADPSFATASAARLMASIARASSERHLPGVHPARGPALLTMDRRTWSAGSGESDCAWARACACAMGA